jgi:hypothetical protein
MSMFGVMMRAAIIQATQQEWMKVPRQEISCVETALSQSGTSIASLVQQGIGPFDPRVANILTGCRYQSRQVQPQAQPLRTMETESPHYPQPKREQSVFAAKGITLGQRVNFNSAEYQEYHCKPSEQYDGFTWCTKQQSERAARGPYTASYTILHNQDGALHQS